MVAEYVVSHCEGDRVVMLTGWSGHSCAVTRTDAGWPVYNVGCCGIFEHTLEFMIYEEVHALEPECEEEWMWELRQAGSHLVGLVEIQADGGFKRLGLNMRSVIENDLPVDCQPSVGPRLGI